MIPREVFDKIAALGLSQEHFMSIMALLFEAVEATVEKTTASYAKQFLEVVETTETKIFARIAQEAAEAEEKKRLRREAIAARKAEREKAKVEGVAAAPDDRFCKENAASKRDNDSNAAEALSSPNHAIEKPADMSDEVKVEDNTDNPPEEGYRKRSEEELEALQRENERVAGVKVGDIWKDGSKVTFVGTGGYVMTERDEYIDLAEYHAHTNTYLLAIEELNREHLDLDTGEYKDPKMNKHIIADMAEEIAQQAVMKAKFQAERQWDADPAIQSNGTANPPVRWGSDVEEIRRTIEAAMR